MKYASAKDIDRLYDLALEHGFALLPMLELGGWTMVMLLQKLFIPHTSRITVVASNDRKGMYALAAAHHLLNHRMYATIVLVQEEVSPEVQYYLDIIRQIGAPIISYQKQQSKALQTINASQLIIDGLLGPNAAKGRDPAINECIRYLLQRDRKIISFDIPSGLDGSTGISFPPVLKAFATLSLGLPTQAFLSKEGPLLSGQIFLGDIGLPKFVYDKLSLGSRPRFDMHENAIMPFKDYLLDTQ